MIRESEKPPRENGHPMPPHPPGFQSGMRDLASRQNRVRDLRRPLKRRGTGPRAGFEELAARFRRPEESARDQKSGDRLRGALILAATAIGCLFLFFGLFTTTTDSSKKERKTQPSLGRPQATATAAETANRSVVPQLNVTQQPNEETGELTEKDLLGTMRNRGTSIPTENVPKPVATAKQTLPKRSTSPALSSVDFEDPALAEAYRRQGLTPPPRRATEVTDWNAAIAEYQAKQNRKGRTGSARFEPERSAEEIIVRLRAH